MYSCTMPPTTPVRRAELNDVSAMRTGTEPSTHLLVRAPAELMIRSSRVRATAFGPRNSRRSLRRRGDA